MTSDLQPRPDEPLPLPGLEEVEPRPPSDVEIGVRRTLRALQLGDEFEEKHAGLLALIIETARQVDRKSAMTKPSSMFYNDARLLFERIDLLLGGNPGDEGFDGRIKSAMEAWAAEMQPDGPP